MEARRTDAIAARPDPIANVIEMIRFTLMPISMEAPLSSEHARMALPVFVLLIKRVRQIMTMIHVTIVSSVR